MAAPRKVSSAQIAYDFFTMLDPEFADDFGKGEDAQAKRRWFMVANRLMGNVKGPLQTSKLVNFLLLCEVDNHLMIADLKGILDKFLAQASHLQLIKLKESTDFWSFCTRCFGVSGHNQLHLEVNKRIHDLDRFDHSLAFHMQKSSIVNKETKQEGYSGLHEDLVEAIEDKDLNKVMELVQLVPSVFVLPHSPLLSVPDGCEEIAEYFIDTLGVSVNGGDFRLDEETPLASAAKEHCPGMVELLLNKNANVHARNPVDGKTALGALLSSSLEEGDEITIELLLKAGAHCDANEGAIIAKFIKTVKNTNPEVVRNIENYLLREAKLIIEQHPIQVDKSLSDLVINFSLGLRKQRNECLLEEDTRASKKPKKSQPEPTSIAGVRRKLDDEASDQSLPKKFAKS